MPFKQLVWEGAVSSKISLPPWLKQWMQVFIFHSNWILLKSFNKSRMAPSYRRGNAFFCYLHKTDTEECIYTQTNRVVNILAMVEIHYSLILWSWPLRHWAVHSNLLSFFDRLRVHTVPPTTRPLRPWRTPINETLWVVGWRCGWRGRRGQRKRVRSEMGLKDVAAGELRDQWVIISH